MIITVNSNQKTMKTKPKKKLIQKAINNDN